MKFLLFLIPLVGIVAASPAPQAEGQAEAQAVAKDVMVFDCAVMPEICTNMCYGIKCLGVGKELRYDKPDKSTKASRRIAAGCRVNGGNRCSVKRGYQKNYQCDEYPFASTKATGKVASRINRCVPKNQNRKQGGRISKFYSDKDYCKGGPCTFKVSFTGEDKISYCSATGPSSKQCKVKDDNQKVGPGGASASVDENSAVDHNEGGKPEDEQAEDMAGGLPALTRRYRTSSGLEINVPGGAVIGQRAVRVVARNETLFEEQANDFNKDDSDDDDDDDDNEKFRHMFDNLMVREETIVEEIK